MKILAYLYSDPLLERISEPQDWGWEVAQTYRDLGDRHFLVQLLEDCENAPPDYLLLQRLEDLGDSVEEVGDRLSQLESLGVQLILVPPASNHPPHCNLDARPDLLTLLQQIQKAIAARRIRQGHARNRLKSLPPPGKAPYGYRRGKDRYILDRTTAPVVKDFFEQFLLYGSLRGAVRYIEKKYRKKISASTGQRWLTSPVYRGDTAFKHGEIISDTHTAIASREEAAQIDRLLRRNRRLSPRSASAPRSLAGLVVCGECQSGMTVTRVTTRQSDREYLYLRPSHCQRATKCPAIAYEEVLHQTITKICQDLPQAIAGMNIPSPEGVKERLTTEINKKQEIIAELPLLTNRGILDLETAELRAYKLQTEISQIQTQLAQLPPPNLLAIAQTVSIPRFWLDLSESERRFYFREFLREIEIVRQSAGWEIELIFIFSP